MKTKALVLSAALLLLHFTSAGSGEEGKSERPVNKSFFSIENQIQSKMTSPFFVSQEMTPQTVYIRFHVTNSFKLIIDQMECSDNRLKSHIEKTLSQEEVFVDRVNVNKPYSIKMTFK